jgi:hypothetical protein
MHLGRVSVVVVLISSCTQLGCSFLQVHGPPPPDATVVVALDGSPCTARNVYPVLDVVVAAAAGSIFVLSGIGTPPPTETASQRQDREQREKIAGLSALVVGGITTASAIWGFHTTHKCRQYIASTTEPQAPPVDPQTP